MPVGYEHRGVGKEPTLSMQPLSHRDLSRHRCWGLLGPRQDSISYYKNRCHQFI